MSATAAAAVVIAVLLDAVVGEFPRRVHPVALFGRVVGHVDRDWRQPRIVGTAVALLLPAVAGVVCWTVVVAGGGLASLLSVVLGGSFAGLPPAGSGLSNRVGVALTAGVVLFSTTSLRMLVGAATDVIDASVDVAETAEGSPAADDSTDSVRSTTHDQRDESTDARAAARALVGRDTTGFSAAQFRSAAVESAAENLADGFLAPLVAFAVGVQTAAVIGTAPPVAVAVGAGAAGWVKAVNTLDSMLGYRSKPVGWASARLDDLVVWLPARLTALVIAVAGLSPSALARARRWADVPASPNSGWPMATLAVVLGVSVAKPDHYQLGEGDLPTVADARRGVRVVTTAALLGALAVCVAVSAEVDWVVEAVATAVVPTMTFSVVWLPTITFSVVASPTIPPTSGVVVWS
jgi:adenosylcobinamide-phosphate synthase